MHGAYVDGEIMADAAVAICVKERSFTGNIVTDEEMLLSEGIASPAIHAFPAEARSRAVNLIRAMHEALTWTGRSWLRDAAVAIPALLCWRLRIATSYRQHLSRTVLAVLVLASMLRRDRSEESVLLQ